MTQEQYFSALHMQPGAMWKLSKREHKLSEDPFGRLRNRTQRVVQYTASHWSGHIDGVGVYYSNKSGMNWCSYEEWLAWTAQVSAEFVGIEPNRIIVKPPSEDLSLPKELPPIGSYWKTKDNRYYKLTSWMRPRPYPMYDYLARFNCVNRKIGQRKDTFIPFWSFGSLLVPANELINSAEIDENTINIEIRDLV